MKRTIITSIIYAILAFTAIDGLAQAPVETGRDAFVRLGRSVDQSGDLEGFRRDLAQFIQDLTIVSRGIIPNLPDQALDSRARADLDRQTADIQRMISNLNGEELALLRSAFSQYPDWRLWPAKMDTVFTPQARQRLRLLGERSAATSTTANLTSLAAGACTPPSYDETSRILLNTALQVTAGAEGVMQLIPEDIFTSIPYVVAAGVWAVLNVLSTTGEVIYDSSNEQADASFVSCQYNEFLAEFARIKSSLIDANAKLEALKTTAGKTEQAVTGISTTVNNINSNVDVVLSSRATQVSVNTVQATANIINGKSDQTLAKLDDVIGRLTKLDKDLADLRVENRRMQIELNLLLGSRYNNVLFQLPKSQGGYLEEVYQIVSSTLAAAKLLPSSFLAGPDFKSLDSQLADGKAQMDAGNHKLAYALFRSVYLAVSINVNTRQP